MATACCLRTSRQTISYFGILARKPQLPPEMFTETVNLLVTSVFLTSHFIFAFIFFTAVNIWFGGWVC